MNKTGRNRFAIAVIATFTSGGAMAANLEIDFDSAEFTNPTVVNNPYWPLSVGTSHVYAAETEDGCEVNRVTTTSTTKGDFAEPYDGISAIEVEDLEWLSEECDGDYILMEKTADWYAQDDDDNIWYLGEETVAYDDELDCLSDEGAWEAGADDAEAGIVILGTPINGLAYRQEYREDEAEDMGKVLALDVTVELQGLETTYAGCMKTKEWTPLERGYIEHKYYCPEGGGLMLINELHGKTVRVEYIGDTLPDGDFPDELPDVDECPED